MNYSAVDPTIEAWRTARGLSMSTEFGGQPRRFCYTSSARGECFQISIEPPEVNEMSGPEITVNLWSIETLDDAEMHYAWVVPVGELRSALDHAWAKAQELKLRALPPSFPRA